MKNRLLCFLLMLTFIQVQSQDTDIIEQLSDFDCEENFFITRNPLPSNVAIGNINGSQLNMECAVPENAQGFNQFTANIYDLDFVQAVNNAPGGACWGIEWEVTGGTIYLSSGGGGWLPEAGSTVCFTAGPNTSLDCNTMCGGGTVDATVANNGYIHSTIRVKWDSNLQDSNVKYGVKAKLFIKAKNKFDFYLIEPKEQGSGDGPPPTSTPLGIKVKVSYSAEVKYQACEKFVEFGANSRLITNANSSALSCSNGGSRTITVNLTDEINRYPTCQIPAPFTINWQQRLGNGGSYQTIATSNSNNIGSNNSISYTFNNLSLTGAHSIRVLTKYGNMVAEERVFDYEPDGSVSGPVAVSVGQQRFYDFTELSGLTDLGTWQAFPSNMVNISNFGTQALYEFLSVGTVNINYATTICGDPVNFPLDVSVTQNGGGGCIVCLTDNESDELTIPTVYNTAFGQPLTVDGLGFYDQQDLQFELYDLSGRSVYSGTLQGDIHIDQIQLPSSMYILRVVNISNKDLVLTQKLLVF